MRKTVEVYRDDRYVLGMEEGLPYLVIGGRKHMLTCHPYEPCLYITDDRGCKTAVHNSFDPVSVLYAFRKGQKVTSITGREWWGALCLSVYDRTLDRFVVIMASASD